MEQVRSYTMITRVDEKIKLWLGEPDTSIFEDFDVFKSDLLFKLVNTSGFFKFFY